MTESKDWDAMYLDEQAKESLATGEWLLDDVINGYCLAVSSSSGGAVVSFATYWQARSVRRAKKSFNSSKVLVHV